jgi:hypothetical protein
MGNLEFNSQNVTRVLRLANSQTTWQSNNQTPIQIVQAGYLRDLDVILSGVTTVTTTAVTLDSFGPWGMISNFQVNSNVQASIINLSGVGANWVDQVIYGLEKNSNTPDTSLVVPAGTAGTLATLYSIPAGAGAGVLTLPYLLPLAQEIKTLDGYVGIWDLQDPSIQMTLLYTPGTSSTATPFNIVEGTAKTGAGQFVQTANTATIATPTMLVTRVMFEPPLDPVNDPEFGFVHSWYEEQWNTTPGGSSVLNWRALANSGYITRLIFGVWDSTTADGVADSKLATSNAINFTIGNNAPVVVESGPEYRNRASQELGHQLPLGVFYIDFLTQDLTMQNVLDTFTAGNINLQANFNAALGGTSTGKVIRGMLQALQQ